MLRRLYHDQPESFAFTPENLAWARAQMTKYPDGRQASAVIAILWRAQEQEGWISRAAIEEIARMLDMASIRVLEVATFYFMFQLQPVGDVAHVQVCGTTSCMICGAEDLIAVCKDKIAPKPYQRSGDGRFSWEEVECLGACANAPMVQIGKDYYEDLTAESFAGLLDAFARGEVPTPGPQDGRTSSEPAEGRTALLDDAVNERNASVALALDLGDTVKRIDGTEVPLTTPWNETGHAEGAARPEPVADDMLGPKGGIDKPTPGPQPSRDRPVDEGGITKQSVTEDDKARPDEADVAPEGGEARPDDDAEAGAAPATSAPPPGQGRESARPSESPLGGGVDPDRKDD